MKRYWQLAAARIDEMSLRQRAMLFAAVSLIVVALAHASLIEPLLARQKSLVDRVNRDQSQLNAVRAQLQGVFQEGQAPKDPDQLALLDLERRIAEAEQSLASRKDALVAPARLPALLKDLLGKNPQVKLESLRAVPGAPVSAAPPAGQEAGAAEIYRHGIEITLKGTYFDLVQYLAEVEQLPSRLLWGSAVLQVEKYPEVRLTVQVHTLSQQRSLLTLQ